MNLKDELDKILTGEKEIGSQFLTDLVNELGNPTLANLLYGLVSSHVEVAKVVQQTPPGQAALAELRKKQAAAKAAQATPAQAAPAAPAVDTAAIVAQVMAQLLPAIQAAQQPLVGQVPLQKPADSSVPQE